MLLFWAVVLILSVLWFYPRICVRVCGWREREVMMCEFKVVSSYDMAIVHIANMQMAYDWIATEKESNRVLISHFDLNLNRSNNAQRQNETSIRIHVSCTASQWWNRTSNGLGLQCCAVVAKLKWLICSQRNKEGALSSSPFEFMNRVTCMLGTPW